MSPVDTPDRESAITDEQLELLRHALGVVRRSSKSKTYSRPYRNHFVAAGDNVAKWDTLVALGLAKLTSRGSLLTGGDRCYSVTEQGREVATRGTRLARPPRDPYR